MQAAPARATTATAAHPFSALPSTLAVRPPSVTGALLALERLLLRGGQRTARRNAWTAVLEDRRRAKDRHEAQHLLEAAAAPGPQAR
ncbi:SCO2195 family GlnR-regulated protein [Streptomyces sp. URMC 126]|uniref:SCO2195 family GlnR-regulated protein n=1 Tax=Streptomyces sp. URMC 126 TaxID=3423401 RepID=UPI003F1A74C1